MGTRSSARTSQMSTVQLPANQQRNVDVLLNDALAYYQSGGPKYFQGNTVAGPTQQQQQGRAAATDYATGAGQQYVNQAIRANQYWLDPSRTTDFSTIPGYENIREGIIRDSTRSLTEGQLPILRDEAILSGQYGGTSQQIGEALAVSRTNEGIANQLANLDLGLYQSNLGMQDAAMARAPMMYDLGLTPANTLEQVGALDRADEQARIDADVARWNFEQMAPLLNLQAFQGLTGTAGQYGGTTNTQGTQSIGDGGAAAMQLVGTALMALAFASHSSLKEDIKPAEGILEKLRKLQINTWKYKGQDVTHIGPMAEEFHRIFGVGDGFTINILDICGVLLGAMKELAEVKANG